MEKQSKMGQVWNPQAFCYLVNKSLQPASSSEDNAQGSKTIKTWNT